ncbi:MAG: MarR family transcriptional regulator [Dehalococcoidia bacterium]
MRPSVEAVAASLFRASALIDPMRLRIWDKKGLTVTQLRLLGFLYQEPGLSNAELADRLYVTRPSVSALLERLERGGFIRREMAENDRRAIRIWLTQDGEQGVVQLKGELLEFAAALFESLSDDQLNKAKAGLDALVESGKKVKASSVMKPVRRR